MLGLSTYRCDWKEFLSGSMDFNSIFTLEMKLDLAPTGTSVDITT